MRVVEERSGNTRYNTGDIVELSPIADVYPSRYYIIVNTAGFYLCVNLETGSVRGKRYGDLDDLIKENFPLRKLTKLHMEE